MKKLSKSLNIIDFSDIIWYNCSKYKIFKEKVMKKVLCLCLLICFSLSLVACLESEAVEQREPIDKGVITEEVLAPDEITETDVITEQEPVDIEPITEVIEPEGSETTEIETEKDPETINTPTIYDTPVEPPCILVNLSDMENQGRDGLSYGDLKNSDLIVELESILDGYAPNISVAAYSLDGSKGYIYNGKQEYFSACTIKMPWMLYLCSELDKGTYDKNTVLVYQEENYRIGSGIIRKGNYGDSYTIEELVNLCLSISDNVAYDMLVKYMGRSGFNSFADALGYQSFKINSWSLWSHNSIVRDYLGLWCKVYDYFLTETDGAKLLKSSCTNTKFNYGTLTLKGEDYSHKSGDNFGDNCVYNDAGLVWSDSPYVYAVFTKSEGTPYDKQIVNSVMSIIHNLF